MSETPRNSIFDMPIFGKPIGDYTMGELKKAHEKAARKIKSDRKRMIEEIKALQKEILRLMLILEIKDRTLNVGKDDNSIQRAIEKTRAAVQLTPEEIEEVHREIAEALKAENTKFDQERRKYFTESDAANGGGA